MAHALLSPSSGSRWIACTPSARLEREFPEQTSSFAEEGSLAHYISELMAANESRELTEEQYQEVSARPYFSEDMIDHARDFNSYVLESMPKNHVLFIEQKVHFDKYVREGFGTIDRLGLHDITLQIFDYKYGKGVLVEAENNTQLKIYAIGAYLEYGFAYDIKRIILHIYQPRLHSVTKWETTIEELLLWAKEVLKPRAELAFAGEGDFVPGSHCGFCKAKALCRALAEANLAAAQDEFGNPDLLDDDEFIKLFCMVKQIDSWLTAIKEHALKQAVKGKSWPGYKLVEGKTVRVLRNPEGLMQDLTLAGYEGVIKKPALVSQEELKKIMGTSAFRKFIEPELYKAGTGKPTLALTSDRRPVLQLNSAADDFADDFDEEYFEEE